MKNDFLTGVLQGLYQGGVGNPEANAANKQSQMELAYKQAALNQNAAKEGLVQDIHPQTDAVIDKVRSFIFPGSGGPTINTAFKPDPSLGTYSQDTSGRTSLLPAGTAIPPGSSKLDREKGASLLASQEKEKTPDSMLVYDRTTGKPRIESLTYIPKPGEMAQKTNLGDALTRTGAFASNESRGGYFDAREGQIRLGAADEIKKTLDPSNLSRGTTLGAAASSVKRAINGLSLLNQPTVTKTALEATMGDIDSILTQASATVEGRKMLNTPNFRNNITDFRSFISGSPEEVAVPEGVVNVYKNILNDLGPIAQNTVKDYVERTSKLQRGNALKFVTPEQYDSYKQEVLDGYDIQKQLNQNSGGRGGSTSSIPTITSDADFNKLPSGSEFIDGIGQKHRKK